MRTLRERLKKKDPRHMTQNHIIHHGSVTLVDARGDRLRLGSAEFRGSLLDSLLRGASWSGELS